MSSDWERVAAQVERLNSLLREAGALITHAGEFSRPATGVSSNSPYLVELLVRAEFITRRKAWLERAAKELGPEWGEKREEVKK